MAPPKESKDSEEEERKEEIRRILSETSPEFKDLEEEKKLDMNTASREYKRFKEEEAAERMGIYEKLCKLSERLNFEPDKEMSEKMEKAIEFAHLKITPAGAFSFAILAGIFIIILSIISLLLGINATTAVLSFALAGAVIFVLIKYPEFMADLFRIKASQEIILAIIYMAIYMRTSPQMEGAVRFAAKNLSGPLAYDLRKILWDVETRKYETIYEAITDYLERWESNRDFIEALQLMNTSLEQPESKRHQMLDEAINIILQGTEEKMKNYSQTLRTPITVIFSLGITLPILVLVMFPIMMLMMSDTIKPSYLIIGYDVVLPIVIFFISYHVLSRRPISYSTPDISLHPKYSPIGKIKIKFGKKDFLLPVWPLGLIVGGIVGGLGLMVMFMDESPIGFVNLVGSLIILWGIGLGLSIFFLLDTKRKVDLREQIKKIQDEFSEALFQLGNRLALGNPFERAMEQTIEKSGELKISDLFRETLNNIKQRNMALKEAMFNKKLGSIWEYPSKLVINIMKIVIESSEKGVKNAATSSMSISRYVKQIHRIEEELNEMMSESSSSMRLLGMFIAPLIAGVTVTLTAIMMLIFDSLGRTMAQLELSGAGAGMGGLGELMIGNWGSISEIISLGGFQLVVGIYTLEVCYLLAYLVAGIESGQGDMIIRRETAGWTIMLGLGVYTISVLATYFMFIPLVSSLVM
ncbi:MAG: hypothetical protein JSV92_01120 [archaeon]|nr:MAG: hypothetical protein JSV92_01120 [archaeon]